MRVLVVTGGVGFVGQASTRDLPQNTEHRVVALTPRHR